MVHWLRFCAPNAGGLGSIPGQGTRFHMLQLNLGKKKKEVMVIYHDEWPGSGS